MGLRPFCHHWGQQNQESVNTNRQCWDVTNYIYFVTFVLDYFYICFGLLLLVTKYFIFYFCVTLIDIIVRRWPRSDSGIVFPTAVNRAYQPPGINATRAQRSLIGHPVAWLCFESKIGWFVSFLSHN